MRVLLLILIYWIALILIYWIAFVFFYWIVCFALKVYLLFVRWWPTDALTRVLRKYFCLKECRTVCMWYVFSCVVKIVFINKALWMKIIFFLFCFCICLGKEKKKKKSTQKTCLKKKLPPAHSELFLFFCLLLYTHRQFPKSSQMKPI